MPETPTLGTTLRKFGFDNAAGDTWRRWIDPVTPGDVERELARPGARWSPARLGAFLSPAANAFLEPMAQAAHALTRQRFGNVINLYAPLYVSNVCINRCRYCGFSAKHGGQRKRLTIDEALADAHRVAREGFRDILLVAGEDPEYVTVDYLAELTAALREQFASIAIEIQPLNEAGYRRLFAAGVDGVTLYQETYDRATYTAMHPPGPKADYDARLASQLAATSAGMRRLGLGALLGLQDWRFEAMALALHAQTLLRHFWRAKVSISFPRLRPAPGVDLPIAHPISDRELTQMMLALRLCFPDLGLIVSTRESATLRDHLLPLGVTQMSAGSKTNPGGYGSGGTTDADEQFAVADTRSAAEVASMLRTRGYDPVWKDWDTGFQETRTTPTMSTAP